MTSFPRAASRPHRCRPRKPVAPVTSTRTAVPVPLSLSRLRPNMLEPQTAELERGEGQRIAHAFREPLRNAIRERGTILLQDALAVQQIGLEEAGEVVERLHLAFRKMIVKIGRAKCRER